MSHSVSIIKSEYVTHDVKRFQVTKPQNYSFAAGQAIDLTIDDPAWKDEVRPFTFTGLNDWDYLEFTIKIYREHHGVTEHLEQLQKGARLNISDPWGAISYKGPGVFIAAGAGITPFIAILRQLKSERKTDECSLIFSNKMESDIILRDELNQILNNRFTNILTREHVIGFRDRRIDESMLIELVKNFDQQFYVCGPDKFVEDINGYLKNLGVNPESLVFEK
jgi:ferredoxin-NADP reductase